MQDTWSFERQHQIDGINRVYQPGLLATKFRVIISEKVGTSHVPFVMTPELEAYNSSDVFQEIERINNKLIELSKSKKKQEALALYNEAMSKYGKYIINADNADEIYLHGYSFLKAIYDQGKAWDLDNQLVLAHEFMHAFAGLSDDYSEDAKPNLMSNLKCSFTEEQREKIVYRLYGKSQGGICTDCQ